MLIFDFTAWSPRMRFTVFKTSFKDHNAKPNGHEHSLNLPRCMVVPDIRPLIISGIGAGYPWIQP